MKSRVFSADFLAETPTDTKVCKSMTPKCNCSFLHSEISASGSFQRNLTDPEFSSVPSAVIFTQTVKTSVPSEVHFVKFSLPLQKVDFWFWCRCNSIFRCTVCFMKDQIVILKGTT